MGGVDYPPISSPSPVPLGLGDHYLPGLLAWEHPLPRHWGWVTATCLAGWRGVGGEGLIHPYLHHLPLRHWG